MNESATVYDHDRRPVWVPFQTYGYISFQCRRCIDDDLGTAIGTIAGVESSSTFPTFTTVQTKSNFNGNACQRQVLAVIFTISLSIRTS